MSENIKFFLTTDLKQRIAEIAKANNTTSAMIIRCSIEYFIERYWEQKKGEETDGMD